VYIGEAERRKSEKGDFREEEEFEEEERESVYEGYIWGKQWAVERKRAREGEQKGEY